MKKAMVLAVILIMLPFMSIWAEDYKAQWQSSDDSYHVIYYNGLTSGFSWWNAITELMVIKEKDARQRLMSYVITNIHKVDPQSVARVASEL